MIKKALLISSIIEEINYQSEHMTFEKLLFQNVDESIEQHSRLAQKAGLVIGTEYYIVPKPTEKGKKQYFDFYPVQALKKGGK